MPIKPKEVVVGRFWRKVDSDGKSYHRGYVDLGVLGRIIVHIQQSPKRPGKERTDADMSMIVDITQTPLGMLALVNDKVDDALYEDQKDKEKEPWEDEDNDLTSEVE